MTAYFPKAKSLFSTTLSSGISTGTGETITPASVSGLPTDAEITLTVDRVDSSGVATPTKLERIRGTIVGGSLTSYTRGVDGTTEQAHSAGAVIEYVFNAADWNSAVDGLLIQHNQDGTHKSALVTTLKSTAAEINTGTEPAKVITPDQLAASGVSTASKTETLTNKNIVQKVTAYTPAGGATATLDVSVGGIHSITMPAGNITIAISNEAVGKCFMIEITQDGTGSRTVTWFTTIKWAGGSAPTLTTAGSKRDTFGFRVTGTDTYDGYVVGKNL